VKAAVLYEPNTPLQIVDEVGPGVAHGALGDQMIFSFRPRYMDGGLNLDQLNGRTCALDEISEGFEALRTCQDARGVVFFA
jgi:Zn-dependent alcohol dehydrogenase